MMDTTTAPARPSAQDDGAVADVSPTVGQTAVKKRQRAPRKAASAPTLTLAQRLRDASIRGQGAKLNNAELRVLVRDAKIMEQAVIDDSALINQ